MSGLYAGITFSKGGSNAAGDEQAANTSISAADKADAAKLEQEAAAYAAKQAEQAAKEQADAQKKAALAFGPAIRRKPAGQASRAKTGNVLATAATSTIITPQSLYTSTSTPQQQQSASAVILSAPAVPSGSAVSASSGSTAAPSHVLTGRTLIVPPSMTLDGDDDINGFKSTAAGKKAANKAKKRSKKNKKEEDPSLAWNAEYDPARPTDYNEYKAYAKAARTERRTQMRREKERQKRLKEAYNESGSSDYTDSDEDSDEERRRRIAKANNRFFAPPTTYDESAAGMPASVDANAALAAALKAAANIPIEINDENDEDDPYRLDNVVVEGQKQDSEKITQPDVIMVDEAEDTSEPVTVTEAAADDWAAWAAAPKEEDDPWARRMALASGPSASNPAPKSTIASSHPGNSASPAPQAAPQPFLQFHQTSSAAAASAAPNLTPSSFASLPSTSPLPLPSALDHLAPIPGLGPPTPSMSPSPSPAPQQSSMPSASTPAGTSVSIEEAQAKARAIAARLAMFKQPAVTAPPASSSGMTPIFSTDDPIPGLGGPAAQAAPQEPKEPSNPEDFAKNLMAKYGWTKGQGLGASSQGIVNPLALSNANDGKKGGKGKGKQPESSKPAGHTKVLGMATAKGRVISDIKTEKDKAEKEKYGEPSRIVCLSNMVGRNEVDAELAEDVAGEARKLGVLESCFTHVMPPYVSDEDSVRVFVVFSGLVGAWKAVKEFDGRFFGGRTVTAKFYDERAYDARALHL